MLKKKQNLILIVLVVVLLVIVSSRIDPKIKADRAKAPETTEEPADLSDLPLPADASDPDAPEETEAPPNIREILPNVSIYEWNLKLVNNTNVLSSNFAPDVTKIEDDQYFDERAADALRAFIGAAREEGFRVCIRAAYRPYSTQAYLFFGKASQIAWGGTVSYEDAEMQARSIVAYPGTGEHQVGLAVDLMDSPDTVMAADEVADLPLLVWLKEHCAEYGFILRYPKDKKDITGWYEPWHFRYVGEDAAAYIMENGLCLEEFYDLYSS